MPDELADRGTAAEPVGIARRTGVGMLWGQAAKSLEALLTLLIAVAAVRALNPNAFGLYSLLTYLAGSASILIPLVMVEGAGGVLPRFGSRRERLALTATLVVLRLSVISAVVLVLLPGWGIFRGLFGLDAISLRVFLVGAVYWLAQDLLNSVAGFYSVELNLRPVALWKPVGQLVTLALIVYVAATEDRWSSSVGEVLAAVAIGSLVSAAGLTFGLRRYGRLQRPPQAGVRAIGAITRNTWLIGILGFVLATQVDVLLIGAITGDPSEVAYYVLAVGVVGRAQVLLVSGWSGLMIPACSQVLVNGGIEGLRRAWELFGKLWLAVSLPVNAILLVLAHPLVEMLFGSAYKRAGDLLVWVAAFGLASSLLLAPPSIAVLWALDKQGAMLRVRLVSAAVNLALAVVLIHREQALGAAIATGIGGLLTGGIEFAVARRHGGVRFPLGAAAAFLVCAAATTVPALVIRPDDVVGVAASLLLGALAYVAVLSLVRPLRDADLAVAARISPRLASGVLRRLARPVPASGA